MIGDTFVDVLNLNLMVGGLVAGFSGLMAGYAGFGGPLILVPVLAFLFSPLEAIGMTAICATVALLALFPNAAKNAHWPEVAPVIITTVLSLSIGLTFLISANPDFIRRGMGVFVTAVALLMMSGWSYRGPRSVVVGGAVGILSGGVTGAFGVPGGPFIVLYFLSAPFPPKTQRANIMVVTTTLGIFLVGGLVTAGVYDAPLLMRAAMITPFFVAGSQIGKRLFAIAPSVWFKRMAIALLLATGLAALIL